MDVFGNGIRNISDINKRIQSTNRVYGGLSYQGSRVLFVNGNIDPWY